MPGYLFHEGGSASCMHGGQISTVSFNKNVLIHNQAVVTQGDTSTVAACSFTLPNGTPHPCVTARWTVALSTCVRVNGQPVVLNSSSGVCQSGDFSPQGTASITATQTSVSAL